MTVSKILGIFKKSPKNWLNKKVKITDMEIKTIEELIKKRNSARENKNFSLADNLREELISMGVEIQDGPDGVTWKWLN